MKIYLVRHGEAVSPEIDPEKPLSPQGRKDVERVARFFGEKSFPLGHIVHSEKLRAKQTAEIFGQHIAPGLRLEKHPSLNPNDPIDSILNYIDGEGDLMIVGHLPFLNKLAGHLVVDNENLILIRFEAATVACLEKSNNSCEIDWVISLQFC